MFTHEISNLIFATIRIYKKLGPDYIGISNGTDVKVEKEKTIVASYRGDTVSFFNFELLKWYPVVQKYGP